MTVVIEAPGPWLVLLGPDEDQPFWHRVPIAYGPHDARFQARNAYPGHIALDEKPEEFHEECGLAWSYHDNRVQANKGPFGCPSEIEARALAGDR